MFDFALLGAGTTIIILAVILLVVIIAFWAIGKRNYFVKLNNNTDEAFATIDVYLKKRYDLIPNLVETVKGYTKHEKETLESVIKARNLAMNATGDNKVQAEQALSGSIKNLFAIAESYPQIKADSQFIGLQAQLKAIETELAQARKYYNGVIKQYNTEIELFPANLISNMMKLKRKIYFELDSEEEKKNVKISF